MKSFTDISQSKKLAEILPIESEDIKTNDELIGFGDIISPSYEQWADIEGFNGKYKISTLGRVLSTNYARKGIPVMLKIRTNNAGYCVVPLRKDGCSKSSNYLIHRLVAQAFIPNPDNLPIVNHLDENPMHNFVFNLEWTSRQFNFHYGTADKRKHRSMLKAVYQCDMEGNIINRFESVYKAGEVLGIKPQNITANLTGRQKTCGGFRFFYVTKYDLPDHGFIKKY